MTPSPSATRGVEPRFRCRACDRTLTARQATLEHCRDVYAARPAICRGVLVQIEGGAITPAVVEAAIERGVALLDFGSAAAGDLVGRDQLVPGGAGEGLGQADAGAGGEAVVGHSINMRSPRAPSHVNATSGVLTAVDAGSVQP